MTAPSFSAAWSRFQEDLYERGRRPVTVKCYGGILRDFAGSLTVPWQHATPRELRRFLDMPSPGSRTGRLAAATRQQYITAIRRFYRFAHLAGLLAEDPMRAVALPRAGQPIPRALPLEDVRTILLAAAGDQRLLVLLWLAFGCGLRSGEISRAQIEDFQLHASPPLLAVPHGKGGRGRLVPLAPPVVEVLRGWLAGRPSRGPLVESRTWPGQPLSPHEVSRQMASHIHALGIDATGHALRHTYATELLRAGRGQNLYSVSRALGHTDTRITSSVYVSSYLGELGDLAALLPDPRAGNGAGRNSEAPGLQNSAEHPWLPVDLADQLGAALEVLDAHGEAVAAAMQTVARVTEGAWLRSLGVTDREQLAGVDLDAIDYPTDAQWEAFEVESGLRRGWTAADRLRDAHPDG